MSELATNRLFFAPEVIQLSMMDCGPASLKSMLDGFGIDVGYGRLRDACSTDVDGTSIDTLEDVAVELGLSAEQVMLPIDHLLIAESEVTPAILVVQRPQTPVHFVVLWRLHGGLAQIMDPAVGRRWVSKESLLSQVYVHRMAVSAEDWREWAATEAFLTPLMRRLANLGIGSDYAQALAGTAKLDSTWKSLGTLDAAARMLERFSHNGGFASPKEIERLLARLCKEGVDSPNIPDAFWTVRPTSAGDDGQEQVLNRGAVLVHVSGHREGSDDRLTETSTALAPELLSSLKERSTTTWAPFVRSLRLSGVALAGVIVPALFIASGTVLIQALLLRSVLDIGYWLGIGSHRIGALGVLAAFLLLALLLSYPLSLVVSGVGRKLEVLLRLALSRKIPRIADQYFHSRLLSDIAQRMHAITMVRSLPTLVTEWLRQGFLLLLSAGALVLLAPWLWPWVLVTLVVSPLLSLLSMSLLQEREMRMRSHDATLTRFYLDALMGIATIRAHDAGSSMLREQESQLVHWSDANQRLQVVTVLIDALQALVGVGLAIGIVTTQVAREGTTGSILLVAYWGLQLPVLAQAMAVASRQVAPIRNMLVRLLELLDAPEEGSSGEDDAVVTNVEIPIATRERDEAAVRTVPLPLNGLAIRPNGNAVTRPRPTRQGARIDIEDVTVRAGGHTVLEHIRLEIAAGSEVAIVGESGAGKSTLIGLLLGWHRPAKGRILLDGKELTCDDLPIWRKRTAWIDPAIQLFNRRFVQNLLYGSDDGVADLGNAIAESDLREVLERLPEGLQTIMGEGGALVSGGEGQRVRLARAWLRRDARLVLLDEPFRGLDRDKRRMLLARARRAWAGSTIVCITHDVSHTLEFKRVVVVADGRIVEDGDPRALACDMGSRYQSMLAAEQFVLESLWASPSWRRFRVENGTVSEQARPDWIDLPALLSEGESPVGLVHD